MSDQTMRTGLYIHFPFCLRKCLYCDFNSSALSKESPKEYVELLLSEMELRLRALAEAVQAPTLYFGGGTPSLMEPALVGRLIERAAELFGLTADAEITLEANPGTLIAERLAGYRAAGVNRLSLGVQSFEDRLLARLGRVHTVAEAYAAYDAARRAGFENISIDLMHSLPEQSPAQWRQALEKAVALSPEHVSAYALSVEEGTPFAALHRQGGLTLPDEEAAARMFETTVELLSSGGYRHYEISNFALAGQESRHNGAYWSRQSYLGFGAGAHSFWNGNGLGRRWQNACALGSYRDALSQGRIPEEDACDLDVDEAISESFFLGLRVLDGLDLAKLNSSFPPEALASRLAEAARLEATGALLREGDLLRLAPQAVIIANSIFSRFI